jgi:hypothetical protein
LSPATADGTTASSPSASIPTSTTVLRILASFSALAEGANGTLGQKGAAFSCRSALSGPLIGNAPGAIGVSAGHSWPGRGRPPITRRSTRFRHDGTVRARPLTATAGMATSWRTEEAPKPGHRARSMTNRSSSTIGTVVRFPRRHARRRCQLPGRGCCVARTPVCCSTAEWLEPALVELSWTEALVGCPGYSVRVSGRQWWSGPGTPAR